VAAGPSSIDTEISTCDERERTNRSLTGAQSAAAGPSTTCSTPPNNISMLEIFQEEGTGTEEDEAWKDGGRYSGRMSTLSANGKAVSSFEGSPYTMLSR
jgi:hypothetical protein